ncbi:MAG: hypothetical protein LBC99_06080 [Spirochaetota bacterium]|jgi:predicted RNA-binding Zn-ribbon protein involved in translation (DUF1610 family)|nr:hypothetical protein [Spirochaetota bacterium]
MGEPTVDISTETFECENCGGLIKFSIARQKFVCASCGSENIALKSSSKVMENVFSRYLEREKKTLPFEGMAQVSCQRCGMEMSFDSKQIAGACPMCGSTQVAVVKQRAGIPPDGIVPFKIDKQDAQQKFREWAKSRWFAPNDFKKRYGEGDLRGMYLPFWTYDADVRSQYTGQGGKQRITTDRNGKTTIVTDWYPVSGVVSSSFDDVQICASDKQQNVRGVLPFDTIHKTAPFSAAHLSGYYAEVYSVKADAAFNEAKQIMEAAMAQLARNDILRRYNSARVHSLQSQYSNITYKHVLLPLWESAFGYKGKVYHYLINGETGKVSGDRPWSVPKITAAVIVVLAILGLLFWFIYVGQYGENSGYDDRPRYYDYNLYNMAPRESDAVYMVKKGQGCRSADGFYNGSIHTERMCA